MVHCGCDVEWQVDAEYGNGHLLIVVYEIEQKNARDRRL